MAIFAVRFILVLIALAAPSIFSACHCLKMCRIYTRTHAAKMIDMETGWYRSFVQFIGKAMGVNNFPIMESLRILIERHRSVP